jgi:hypothetical protein
MFLELFKTLLFGKVFSYKIMAEKGGFGPPRQFPGLLAFQASPFSLLGISPI